jgi:hypothetical protein
MQPFQGSFWSGRIPFDTFLTTLFLANKSCDAVMLLSLFSFTISCQHHDEKAQEKYSSGRLAMEDGRVCGAS